MYLGIDLGTSEVKVLLLARTARSSAPPARRSPCRGRIRAGPNSIRTTGGKARSLAALRERHRDAFAAVRGIGLSGQMHGAVLLGRDDRVLRPRSWNDMRSADECALLTERAPDLHALAGNLAMPGFTAPKLQGREARTRRVRGNRLRADAEGLPAVPADRREGVRSVGRRRHGLDVARRDWSDALLAACGMTRDQMPRIVEGNAPSGTLRADIARELGLSEAVVVAGGGGDNATSALGIGAIHAGDGFVSLGTSGVLSVVGDRFMPNPASAVHAFCHAIPDRWQLMSVVLSAASCLRWVCKLTGTDGRAARGNRNARRRRARDGPLFLPYLSGERTPHNDPYAQGVFFDDTCDRTRASRLRGARRRDARPRRRSRRAARGRRNRPAVADRRRRAQRVLGAVDRRCAERAHAPARRRRNRRGARRGTARLAGRRRRSACGADLPPVRAEYTPDAARHALLRERLDAFRALYRHVQPLYEPSRARLA